MKFSDFICREAIRTNLQAEEKKAVIRAMATSLLEAGKINEKDFDSIVEAILKREELGSTGIGRGGCNSERAGDMVPATGAMAAMRSDSEIASRFDM